MKALFEFLFNWKKPKSLNFSGKVFETSLQATTDIHGGGHFLYGFYRNRLSFIDETQVEYSKISYSNQDPTDEVSVKTYYKGTYKKPDIGHYTLEVYMKHIKIDTFMNLYLQYRSDGLLLCHGYAKDKKGNTWDKNELFGLKVEESI